MKKLKVYVFLLISTVYAIEISYAQETKPKSRTERKMFLGKRGAPSTDQAQTEKTKKSNAARALRIENDLNRTLENMKLEHNTDMSHQEQIKNTFVDLYNSSIGNYTDLHTPTREEFLHRSNKQIQSPVDSHMEYRDLLHIISSRKHFVVHFFDLFDQSGEKFTAYIIYLTNNDRLTLGEPFTPIEEHYKNQIPKNLGEINDITKEMPHLIRIFEKFKTATATDQNTIASQFMNFYNTINKSQSITSLMQALDLLRDLQRTGATIESSTIAGKTFIVKNIGGKKTSLTPTAPKATWKKGVITE